MVNEFSPLVNVAAMPRTHATAARRVSAKRKTALMRA
jgi:hypothetical protein